MKPPRKLHIKSYGCQMNVYDAQRMVDTLAPEGFVETASVDDADLVILNTCQHPLDPNPKYEPKPIRLSIRKARPAGAADPCRRFRPENSRGFTLTERYFV